MRRMRPGLRVRLYLQDTRNELLRWYVRVTPTAWQAAFSAGTHHRKTATETHQSVGTHANTHSCMHSLTHTHDYTPGTSSLLYVCGWVLRFSGLYGLGRHAMRRCVSVSANACYCTEATPSQVSVAPLPSKRCTERAVRCSCNLPSVYANARMGVTEHAMEGP